MYYIVSSKLLANFIYPDNEKESMLGYTYRNKEQKSVMRIYYIKGSSKRFK